MTSVKQKVAATVTAAGTIGAVMVAGATEASAAGPYLKNNYASYTPASCYDIAACNDTQSGNIYPANGTGFGMQCFFDAQSQMGNYTTNRYFIGSVGGHPGRWVVHASYVINQVSVGRC